MPIEILMPALSPTMTEGNLAKWLKNEGEAVKPGDVIAEIETDKATMEVEAVDEGKLGKILVPAGSQGVKVNQPIALLLEEGEDASALAKAGAAAPKAPPPGGRTCSCCGTGTSGAAARCGAGHCSRAGCGSRRGARLCQSAGAPHGAAGRARFDPAQRQRAARSHRQGRY
jgi:pyruvate dehydrogenase E2 component (dihydrolipoamide acetyltransferase)